MPIYDCNCPNCGLIEDVWAKVDNIYPACPKCGHAMVRLLSPTRINPDIDPYFDENLGNQEKYPQGQWVSSRQDRRRKMKELGLAEIG